VIDQTRAAVPGLLAGLATNESCLDLRGNCDCGQPTALWTQQDAPSTAPGVGGIMAAYAVAHMRQVIMGPDFVEYLHRIDATLEPFGDRAARDLPATP
jgi:hypothetical protein